MRRGCAPISGTVGQARCRQYRSQSGGQAGSLENCRTSHPDSPQRARRTQRKQSTTEARRKAKGRNQWKSVKSVASVLRFSAFICVHQRQNKTLCHITGLSRSFRASCWPSTLCALILITIISRAAQLEQALYPAGGAGTSWLIQQNH